MTVPPFDRSLDPGIPEEVSLDIMDEEEEVGPDVLTPEEVQRIVKQQVERARNFIDTEISPERAKATKYYNGEKFGNEEEGRSQVVSTDVRDAIQSMLPSLMRVFFGQDAVVQYQPNSPEQAPQAKEASQLANTVFVEENPGFNILYSALKDALLKDIGIIKCWWEDEEVETQYSMTGMTPEDVAMLETQPGVEISNIEPDPDTQLLDVDILRRNTDGCIRVEALPPEEFLWSENARDINDALLIAHRTTLRKDELLAMGIDEEFIDEHGGVNSDLITNEEQIQRSVNKSASDAEDGFDETSTKIDYVEAYMYLDEDGDGFAEHRRYVLLGTSLAIWESTLWPGRPFALFVPDPEPHTMLGLGVYDYLKDIQRIKSSILRASLDSLAFAINPRTIVVEGQANIKDVLNTEIGATIREKAPGMIREFAHSYLGKEAFPMLQYMDEQKENRTGTSKAAAGLDPDALQSSTRVAVAATVSGSRQHLELTARIFAENGMKQLFTLILKLLVSHQKPRMVNVPGQGFTKIDPTPWDVTMKVDVEVALGTDEERIQTLMAVAANQKEILTQFGMQNPITTVQQYRDTLARMVAIGGFQPDLFYQQVDPNWQPPPEPPPPPTSEEAFILVEQMKAKTNVLTEQMKNQTSLLETLLREDRERDRIEVDAHIRLLEIEAKSGKDLDEAMIGLIMEKSRREIESARVKAQMDIAQTSQGLAQISQEAQQQAQPQPPPQQGPAQ